ncbi:MAG: Gfo/Idh/MocA family oxidoreductase, partial [Planctomycetota bacterium]
MTKNESSNSATRRTFLKAASTTAAIAGTMTIPRNAHAAGTNDRLKVGLVGCGGRGSGAAQNAVNGDKNCEIWAMGDAFEDRLNLSKPVIKAHCGDQFNVSDERCFTGFDAYQKVIDSGVDVVILTTPPHFRPEQFEAVVAAGKHCFIEKPIAVDVPGVKRVQAACELAQQKGLAVVSGLCWRYDLGVRETMARVLDGAIGDIVAVQSTYNAGTLWHRGDKPEWSRMEYQMRNWLYYTWLSGDHICEQAVHSLDKTAWLNNDASPVSAYG